MELTVVPPVVASWDKLEDLALDGTAIAEVPAWLVEMPSLKRVSFSGSRLKNLPKNIRSWRKLQVLDVSNTPLSENAAECQRIRAELGDDVTILF